MTPQSLWLADRSLTDLTVNTVEGILGCNLWPPGVCSSRKSAQKRANPALCSSFQRLFGLRLQLPGEFSDELPVEVGVAVLAKYKEKVEVWSFSELNQPELVENKPVAQLRLVQDGLEMLFEVRIKLVPHLIVLSN